MPPLIRFKIIKLNGKPYCLNLIGIVRSAFCQYNMLFLLGKIFTDIPSWVEQKREKIDRIALFPGL
jgi:hypothetical protein